MADVTMPQDAPAPGLAGLLARAAPVDDQRGLVWHLVTTLGQAIVGGAIAPGQTLPEAELGPTVRRQSDRGAGGDAHPLQQGPARSRARVPARACVRLRRGTCSTPLC